MTETSTLGRLRFHPGIRTRLASLRDRSPSRTAASSASRKAFVNLAGTFTPYVVAEVDELLFFVSTADKLGRSLFAHQRRQDLDVLQRSLAILAEHGGRPPSESTLLEVGANIGTTTVSAIRRFGFKKVVALEPEPGNFRLLQLNLLANDAAAQVELLQVAASDRSGPVRLTVSSRSSGVHTVVPADEAHIPGTIPTQAVSLDDLADDLLFAPEEIGLLWVDAAGGETPVLAGASTLLDRGTPLVVAVRPNLPDWAEARTRLSRLLGSYTHFANVRLAEPALRDRLEDVFETLQSPGDILAMRI
jgi:FkbM family methyltransferase